MSAKQKFYLTAAVFLMVLLVMIWPDARGYFLELGWRYGYIGLFIISFLGGISLFVPLPYPLVIIPLVSAGLNPWILALSSGVGATLGDAVSYYLGLSGGEAYSKQFSRFQNWAGGFRERHAWAAPLILFVWAAFVPFPNEIFIIPFGITKYGIWKTIAITATGNIVFVLLIAKGIHILIS